MAVHQQQKWCHYLCLSVILMTFGILYIISTKTPLLSANEAARTGLSSKVTTDTNRHAPNSSEATRTLLSPAVTNHTGHYVLTSNGTVRSSLSSRATNQTTDHFLTLITTWRSSNSSSPSVDRTINNWSRLKPEVTVVVYIDDVRVMSQVEKIPGWYTRNVPKTMTARQLPVLKYMMTETIDFFSSKYYCFVNSDILFTHNIIDTLKFVDAKFGGTERPIFMVGQRWDVLHITDEEAATDSTLSKTAATRGKLFPSWGADYFLTNKRYSWTDIPEFVIGVPIFDNWLMFQARYNRTVIAIDASKTITAVHQSVNKFPYASAYKPFSDYNRKLLNSSLLRKFNTGKTDCLPWYTRLVNQRSKARLVQRRTYNSYCNSY